MPIRKFPWLSLIVALILPQAAGVIGGFFSVANVSDWYQTLLDSVVE